MCQVPARKQRHSALSGPLPRRVVPAPLSRPAGIRASSPEVQPWESEETSPSLGSRFNPAKGRRPSPGPWNPPPPSTPTLLFPPSVSFPSLLSFMSLPSFLPPPARPPPAHYLPEAAEEGGQPFCHPRSRHPRLAVSDTHRSPVDHTRRPRRAGATDGQLSRNPTPHPLSSARQPSEPRLTSSALFQVGQNASSRQPAAQTAVPQGQGSPAQGFNPGRAGGPRPPASPPFFACLSPP
jgi:hypothetical protein